MKQKVPMICNIVSLILLIVFVIKSIVDYTQYRDHDNIEVNMVSDTVAMYVLTDDAPPCCDHFYCSAASTQERTEVYVVPARDFPQWLVLEPLIPDEGVTLHENVPERRQKHV